MSYTDLIVEKRDLAVWVTLNKPHRKNAIGKQTLLELSSVLDDIEKDPQCVALVIRGAGDSFCSGMDLKDAASPDPIERASFKRLADRVFSRIENLNKVTVAIVHGYTMAGGLELAMLCDVIIAEENARIGDGHIRTGLVPQGGGSQRLPRLIGVKKAKELLFTGELISGREAERIGLVNKAVPAERLEEEAQLFINKLIDKPPLALAAMKVLVDKGIESSLASALEFEAHMVRVLEATEDFKEAIAAFTEKRKPVYKGR